jgi:hypothetical protein
MKLNDEIKKSNPFKVPEGYFDTLTERTMSAIRKSRGEADPALDTRLSGGADAAKEDAARTDTGTPVRRISFRPFLALAAAILGFALLATVMVRLVTGDRASARYEAGNGLYADLAAEGLDTYFIEHELLQTEPGEITGTEQSISSDVIIDYLMTEDIDLNDIYELL